MNTPSQKCHRFSSVVSVATVLLLTFSIDTSATPKQSLKEALIQARQHLAHKVTRIQNFHDAARTSMRESLNVPLFKQYFELPESHHDKYDEMGRIQLSDQQHKIRAEMEQLILGLHSKFPIGETCLIDKHGQEHLRVVGGELEKPHLFSSEEHGAPFFTPTFKKKKGQVHISKPYMSADILSWVTAFTSPIYLDDNTVPGFYHFEIPLSAYSDLISFKDFSFTMFNSSQLDIEEEGRYFIINKDSLVVADSEKKIDYNLPDERNPDINLELPDYLPPEKLSDYAEVFSDIVPQEMSKDIAHQMRIDKKGSFPLKIHGQSYILVFHQVPDRPDWILGHLDPIGGVGYWDKNITKP